MYVCVLCVVYWSEQLKTIDLYISILVQSAVCLRLMSLLFDICLFWTWMTQPKNRENKTKSAANENSDRARIFTCALCFYLHLEHCLCNYLFSHAALFNTCALLLLLSLPMTVANSLSFWLDCRHSIPFAIILFDQSEFQTHHPLFRFIQTYYFNILHSKIVLVFTGNK